MTWSPERIDMLCQMWAWGISSGEIAKSLGGVTRNGVMGKINRLKLMGRGGELLLRYDPNPKVSEEDVGESVADLLGEPYDRARHLHRNAAVTLACLLAGRHAPTARRILQYSDAEIEGALNDLHNTRAWRRHDPPPASWWHHDEGRFAFMLDMMASAGMVEIVGACDRDRAYGPARGPGARSGQDGQDPTP